MTKKDIVKNVLAELKAKGLLNEGAIKKYVAKKKLKESFPRPDRMRDSMRDLSDIALEILNMNGGSVEGVDETLLAAQAKKIDSTLTDTQARQAVSMAFQFEANP